MLLRRPTLLPGRLGPSDFGLNPARIDPAIEQAELIDLIQSAKLASRRRRDRDEAPVTGARAEATCELRSKRQRR